MAYQRTPVIAQVLSERQQGADTRTRLLRRLQNRLGRTVVCYFTSFVYPVMIDDTDRDILESILQKLDLSSGLALIVSSPGGDGLAAERIVKVCRSFSGTGEYTVIVPGKAKSAATMVCFGASHIYMSRTSELGPVDPQITMPEGSSLKRYSVHNVVRSYRDLFERAVATDGHLEPYLQQLAHYDERDIRELESQLELSDDIAMRSLSTGMMAGHTPTEIRECIEATFLTPDQTKNHGRPIFMDEAMRCGLAITPLEEDAEVYGLCNEIQVRTNEFVSTQAGKTIESVRHSLFVPYDKR